MKTCGGSTGGGAVNLACGMATIADGSDSGGSLRNPAAFSNVTGLRPASGRVPIGCAKACESHGSKTWAAYRSISRFSGAFRRRPPYPTEIEGVKMSSYIEWQKSCILISALENPAMSVHCGFTPERLPVGLQIAARHRDERSVLQLARLFEQAAEAANRPFTQPSAVL